MSMMSAVGGLCLPGGRRRPRLSIPLLEGGGGEAAEKMAAMAAEAAATAAVPGDGGAGEAEPEMEPIPGSEAGADPLPAVSEAVESAVPDGDEADGGKPAPGEAEEPPPPVELARSPARTQEPEPERTEPEEPELGLPQSEPREAPSPEPEDAPQPCPQPAGHPELPEEEPQPCPPAAGGPVEPEPGEEPCRPEEEEPDAADAAAVKPEPPAAGSPVAPAGGEAEAPLLPGSEVRVTLDHIIEDALVVSFRLGEKLFSGVLMDLSKRFGPHGIPVTIFPKREYKDKPEAMQLQSKPFQDETQVKCEASGAIPDDSSPIQPSEPSLAKSLWTSKPPPLFHEGAPYPPPLFIRDTYNQSIPQPPPRKIKRPKRKMYREEPTSIMNAIKLRPRQVLCDKCKNSVVAEKKEIKKSGNASDCLKYEDHKKRRNESVTTVNKKIKTDHKIDGKSQNESQKRNAVVKVSNIAHSRSKVVKVSAQANTSKAQLNTKKVLQSKNMDHAKAREVLKMAKEKAQKKQSATSTSKNAHSKVHFTRRLQNTSSGSLPPRLRLKPQRYRNEENDSSLKTGLEKIRSGKMATKPQSRCSSTRSAGEAPSENQSPSEGPEEASSEVQDTSEVHVTVDQDEHQTLGKRGSKSNITVYMTLNQKKSDSSSASVCSSDSTDDLKSTNSECSSTESFDFPPGSMHAPSSSSSSSSSKEEKKLSNSLKMKVFSKNVSKCVTPDGRTICVGDIVWAKIYGFPWWPARILTITVSRKDNGLLVRQEARISWFGSPTTSFLALSQLSPFLENFQSRFNKKRKGLYRKAITEAAKAAKQLTPEVRALLTQFET
uniref:PWWP domain containing 2A n=1 Tax=Chrysemys picta bellii TaxID=8478 RepID=A0A8C3FQK2_CHRPI|nr:PWWP domain-containing protein 2A isoform X1 [Chrysemys picta bellii]XP_008177790.1 PWWP domain-containing protein 2A isoform X1 [Chrysemys picta bellii]